MFTFVAFHPTIVFRLTCFKEKNVTLHFHLFACTHLRVEALYPLVLCAHVHMSLDDPKWAKPILEPYPHLMDQMWICFFSFLSVEKNTSLKNALHFKKLEDQRPRSLQEDLWSKMLFWAHNSVQKDQTWTFVS